MRSTCKIPLQVVLLALLLTLLRPSTADRWQLRKVTTNQYDPSIDVNEAYDTGTSTTDVTASTPPPTGFEWLYVTSFIKSSTTTTLGWRKISGPMVFASFTKYPYLMLFFQSGVAPPCTDVGAPGDTNTCAQQAGWGNCGQSWMQGYCRKSCNTCLQNVTITPDKIGLYMQASDTTINWWLKPPTVTATSKTFVLSQIAGVNTTTIGPWTKYTIPTKTWYGVYDILNIQFLNTTSAQVLFAGFYGNPDGSNDPPPALPVTPNITIDQPYTFITMNQSVANVDSGTTPQYLCPPAPPTVAFPQLKDVNIQGWRDTNVGIPLPMNVSQGITITNGIATIPGIFSTITYDAALYPHPALVCGMHNADYIEIGNTTLVGRNNTLAVWAPELYWDITHMIAAYATYIRNTRDANGQDTMAVYVRIRPNPAQIGMDYPWVQRATFNCSAAAPIWQCPDHILFQDYQLSYLKDGRNMLRSLDDLELAYFENTGIKASMEIHPVVRKYTVYNGQNYAMPFALMFEPWMVNKTTLLNLNLPYPPNGSQATQDYWGKAWWDTWNITTFSNYVDAMYNAGHSYIVPLPSDTTGTTRYGTFLGFPFGATVLSADGRCGLNDKMVQALNNTLVKWRNLTDWSLGDQTYTTFRTKPGYLQWRGRYNEPKNFTVWMNSSMKDNPFDEPIFNWGTAFDTSTPTPKIPWQPGFALISGYSLMKIYPPTGAAAVMPKLLGISKQTRNATLAFKVLMEAFARNNVFQVNCPSLNTNNAGGVSGYLAAPNIPEWLSTKKSFYDGMLDHAMAVGEPAAQSMSYGRISLYDPFQVALNDILYKGVDIATALNRSCTMIDFLTKPPCTSDDMEPYLVDDPLKNSATLMYRWKDVRDCNETLPNAAAIPAPLVAAVPTSYLSTESGLVKAMTGLAAACMAILLLFILMFFHKRDTKVMRAASRLFSFLILFGGEVTLASVIARISGVEKVGWPQCFGTYWFFAIGYGLVMGSLLVKTYRVDRIFRNKKMGFKLPDILLLAYVVFIILVEVAFLLVLQFKLDDPSYTQYIQIPLTETYVAQDACPKSSAIGPGLLYAWNGFIILLAAIYAFRTKNVNSDFNENKFTVAAIVLISVISIIIVPVLSIISNPNAIFLMVSLGTILGTFASTVVFAVPKLAIAYEVYSVSEAVSKIGNSTIASRIGTATMGSSTSPQASVKPTSTPASAKSTVRKSTTADIHATSSAGGSSGTASVGKMV